MAKAKIRGTIPGIDGEIEVTGNLATEDAIEDLIKAIESQSRIQKTDIDDFNKEVEEAADSLDDFNDQVSKAEKAQAGLTKRMADFANRTNDGIQGMQRFADSGGSLSSVVDSVGEIAIGVARGIGGVIPFVGEGLEELGGAAATAVVGLTSLAVSTVESFIGLNKNIFNAGLQVQGGFSTFANFAEQASLPVNEFASAMLQSTDRLRLFASGAPGGIGRVSAALEEFRDQGIMENLYSLGFTTEEIVAGMADYAVAAQRAGRNLSTAELAEGSERYLKNLRELGRLSGETVSDTQKRLEQDRANLFVQNQLNGLNTEQRAAVQSYLASLNDADRMMADYILTGQSQTATSGVLVSQNQAYADTLRSTVSTIINSNGDLEGALAQEQEMLRRNAGIIDAQGRQTASQFGVVMDDVTGYGNALGQAVLSARERVAAATGEDLSGGTTVEEGSMQAVLGNFEQTLNNVQSEIQSVFIDGVSGVSPLLDKFATGVDEGAEAAGDFKRMLQKILDGDYTDLKASLSAGGNALESLQTAISDAILEGFNKVLAQSWLGRQFLDSEPKFTPVDTETMNNILNEAASIDPNNPLLGAGQANGGIVTGPTSGYIEKLHGTEAVVPLPDGRSIPVSLTTSGMSQMLDSIIDNTVNQIADTNTEVSTNMTASLDNSRTLGEMLQVNKNMLTQMVSNVQKTDQIIRAMENANLISRTTAYTRA